MTTFTIEADNNITAHTTPEYAAAAGKAAGVQSFASQQELAELAGAWPASRLVEIWNSLPGATPVKKFKGPAAAARRIWAQIQSLNKPAEPKPSRKSAPAKPKTKTKIARAKKPAPKKTKAVREGSKTAQVVAMLQRKGGATLSDITSKMRWQKHTVRGFMAGTLKKSGYKVESFKPEGGERTYRLPK